MSPIKYIGLTFIIFIALAMLLFINKNSKVTNVDIQSQNKATLWYQLIEERYNSGYIQNYAGAYIDNNKILNINIVGTDNKEISNLINNGNIKYHTVKYTLIYLKNIVNILSENMYESGIGSVGLDIINNKVIVSIRDFNTPNIKKIKGKVDSPAVEFIKLEHEWQEK